MARIFMDGWEHGQPASQIVRSNSNDFEDSMWQHRVFNDTSSTNPLYGYLQAQATTTYNSGAYALRVDANINTTVFTYQVCEYRDLGSTYSKLFARMNFRFDSTIETVDNRIFAFDDAAGYGNSLSMQLSVNANDGTIKLYVNGTVQSTVSGSLVSGTWHLLEIMYDNAGSNIIVRVDNVDIIDYSGTIDNNIQYVTVGKCDGSFTTKTKFTYYFDDFALNDDSGSVNNTWIGAGVIRLIKPTSDDTNTDFTPSSGSDHYAMVDDFPGDGDTTYNSSTTSGDIDTFGLENVPTIITGQTINAIQAVYMARSETDVASVAPILISGATTDTGSTEVTVLNDYNKTNQKVYDLDPNTSAQWTETNVNAVKGGYKNAT